MRQGEVLQGLAEEAFGACDFDDGEAFHERQVVEHVRAVEPFRERDGHVAFGMEDVRHAELFEDNRMGGTTGLRDDVLDAQFLEVEDRQERCLQVFTDTADDAVHLGKRQRLELLLAGAVGNDRLRHLVRDILDLFGARVHDHHVVSECGQMAGQEIARVSETDYYELFRSHDPNLVKAGSS